MSGHVMSMRRRFEVDKDTCVPTPWMPLGFAVAAFIQWCINGVHVMLSCFSHARFHVSCFFSCFHASCRPDFQFRLRSKFQDDRAAETSSNLKVRRLGLEIFQSACRICIPPRCKRVEPHVMRHIMPCRFAIEDTNPSRRPDLATWYGATIYF